MAIYRMSIDAKQLKGRGTARKRLVKALHGAPFKRLKRLGKTSRLWELETIAARIDDVIHRFRKLHAVETVSLKDDASNASTSPGEDSDNGEDEPITDMLFVLPAEVRNHIYRLVLVTNGMINVPPPGYRRRPKNPALLQVCSQARREGIKIYHEENQFRFFIANLDASAYISWCKSSKLRRALAPRFLLFNPYVNWQSLLTWLKSFWRGECEGMSKCHVDYHRKVRNTVAGLFCLVEKMKQADNMQWHEVEEALEEVHTILGVQNKAWR